jgi:neutral ceramidase
MLMRLFRFASVLTFLFCGFGGVVSSAFGLQAGAATSNITPDIGGFVVGGFSPFPSTHIHDELHARCLVLDDGQQRLAIVVCDLLGAARQMFDESARLVEKECGIPRSRVLMSCTHTHSASSALSENRYDSLSMELSAYQRFVARRIADGVRRAVNLLQPAEIGFASAQVPGQVFNRRWFMKEGTVPPNPFGGIDRVKMNPGYSQHLVKPAGPTDPEVSLLAVRAKSGAWISVLANYSLHYVGDVGAGHISSDYFGVFCERLENLLGAVDQDPPFVGLLSNGTSGDVNNNDYSRPSAPQGPKYSKIRKVAEDVAQASVKALQSVSWMSEVKLDARFTDLRLKQRRPSPEQIAWAERTLTQPIVLGKGSASILPRAYAERCLKLKDAPDEICIPVQALRIGPAAITGIACETFAETGLDLKARSPFQPTWTHSIAGGYYGYLPTPPQHELGGYETWLGTNRLEPQASVKITETLLEQLRDMKGRP